MTALIYLAQACKSGSWLLVCWRGSDRPFSPAVLLLLRQARNGTSLGANRCHRLI